MAARRFSVKRGPAANRFEWPEELVALLGKRPDGELAELAGVHPDTVAEERQRRGIEAFIPKQRIDWTPEVIAMLGTDSDYQIAAWLGISRGAVFSKRRALGIPPYNPPPHNSWHELEWPAEALDLLGKVPDGEIAEMIGVAVSTVGTKRRRLEIPPYRPKAPRIDWTQEKLELLGVVPDWKVARQLGVSTVAVTKGWLRRRIAPFRRGGGRVVPTPELVELLHLPTTVAAQRSGLKSDTIRRLRKELGITVKTVKQIARESRWNPEVLASLGKEPDHVIAEQIGVTPSRVCAVRKRLGIPSPQRVVRPWQPEEIAQLGTAPDPVIAKRLGRNLAYLGQKRRSLGIPAYRRPRS